MFQNFQNFQNFQISKFLNFKNFKSILKSAVLPASLMHLFPVWIILMVSTAGHYKLCPRYHLVDIWGYIDHSCSYWTTRGVSLQEEVTDLLLEAMAKHPESKGFLIDGFPASIDQAKICEEKLGKPEWVKDHISYLVITFTQTRFLDWSQILHPKTTIITPKNNCLPASIDQA